MGFINLLILFLLATSIAVATGNTTGSQVKHPSCEEICGNVSIPYPFGTTADCYHDDDFLVTCNKSFEHPKLFLGSSNIGIIDISIDGEVIVDLFIAVDCYTSPGVHSPSTSYDMTLTLSKFPFSVTQNMFTAIGCDTTALLANPTMGGRNSIGCMSWCDSMASVTNNSCNGIGCCQTSVPKNLLKYKTSVSSFGNHSSPIWEFNPCSYSFIVDKRSFNFTSNYLSGISRETLFPAVLDWAVGIQNCKEAEKDSSYACQGNSKCIDSDNGAGYRCNCMDGYEGNPYLPPDNTGCRDINECEQNKTLCSYKCQNLEGTYKCIERQRNDNVLVIKVIPSISVGLLILFLCICSLLWGLRQRELAKRKEKFFQQNGGGLLRQQLSTPEGSNHGATRIFTSEDLKKSTNNYHESRVLGQGGQGTVYKGILSDKIVVAVKKSNKIDKTQIAQFINEVIVLSQINHRNVVKLLGCCLEEETPLLVYEYITNGTLFDHIDNVGPTAFSMSWESRLRVATETAVAISYLHSEASTPIIHRDVKSANILLDNNFVAKVSDFGASRLIPAEQSHVNTLIQGTFGYLDPEYLQSSILTEKSDVYSFGVVLVELLTGKTVPSFAKSEQGKNLSKHFVSSMKGNTLFEIIDEQVAREGNVEQIKEVAALANRCLRVSGEDRPSMKEVFMELEALRLMEKHSWVKGGSSLEESEHLLVEFSDAHSRGDSSTIGYDSIRNQVGSVFGEGR